MKFSDQEKMTAEFHMKGGFIYQTAGHPLILSQQLSAAAEGLLVQYRENTATEINQLKVLIHNINQYFKLAPPVGSEMERQLKLILPAWENPAATLKESNE
jgi:hypothetical protein